MVASDATHAGTGPAEQYITSDDSICTNITVDVRTSLYVHSQTCVG